jgi:hypothetical protein
MGIMNGTVTGGGSGVPVISGFKVEDIDKYEFTHLMRELKPYVKDDKTAFSLYHTSRVFAGISKGATYYCLATVVFLAGKILGSADMKDLKPYTTVFLYGFYLDVATSLGHSWSLRKCIKVYNKNAGFGYVTGLRDKDK